MNTIKRQLIENFSILKKTRAMEQYESINVINLDDNKNRE